MAPDQNVKDSREPLMNLLPQLFRPPRNGKPGSVDKHGARAAMFANVQKRRARACSIGAMRK